MENLIIIILVAVVVGLVVGIVVYRHSEAKEKQRIDNAVKKYKDDIEALKNEHQEALKKKEDDLKEVLDTQIKAFKGYMIQTFADQMNDRTNDFKKNNADAMEGILKPMKDQLDKFEKMVQNNSTTHTSQITSLQTMINTLTEQDNKQDKTTKDLANALKNRGKVQGDWRKQVLKDILSESNIKNDYIIEGNTSDLTDVEEGEKNVNPDVFIKLPDNGTLVIDSNVNLDAYYDYDKAETEDERNEARNANCKSIEDHVKKLSKKHNDKKIKDGSKIILMFVPIEGSYLLAMNADDKLGIKAWNDHKVAIVNPTNLMMVLKLVSVFWINTNHEANAEKIYKAAKGVYDKYKTFASHFESVGNGLNKLVKNYNDAKSVLNEGEDNFSKQVNKLLQDNPLTSAKTNQLEQRSFDDITTNDTDDEED